MKTAAYFLTGSVGLLSDALESVVNLVAAILALIAIAAAAKPAEVEAKTAGAPKADVPKTTDAPADTGAGEAANKAATKKVSRAKKASGTVAGQGQGEPVPEENGKSAPGAPGPTESRPARKPRKKKGGDGDTDAAPEGS